VVSLDEVPAAPLRRPARSVSHDDATMK